MHVLALTPRGYCHGVVNAIRTLKDIAYDSTIKRPIYVLGMVVHNTKIVEDFEALGIETLHDEDKTRLELLDEIDTGTIVFTAHGVSDQVYAKAKQKNLNIIDTTCRDVKASQDTVKIYLKNRFDIIFIGRHNHPESETVASYSNRVHIVSSVADIKKLKLTNKKIAMTNQTTMSLLDIYHLSETLKKQYPALEIIEELCDATKTRQLAIMHQPKTIEHCYVVGDRRSNNSNKLVEVSKKQGIDATLIQSVEDLDIEQLKILTVVSVSSGASTPSQTTKEVIDFLTRFDKHDVNTHDKTSYVNQKNLFKTKW